jgi:hypothetical protein
VKQIVGGLMQRNHNSLICRFLLRKAGVKVDDFLCKHIALVGRTDWKSVYPAKLELEGISIGGAAVFYCRETRKLPQENSR